MSAEKDKETAASLFWQFTVDDEEPAIAAFAAAITAARAEGERVGHSRGVAEERERALACVDAWWRASINGAVWIDRLRDSIASGEPTKTLAGGPGGEQENADPAPTERHSGQLGTVPGRSFSEERAREVADALFVKCVDCTSEERDEPGFRCGSCGEYGFIPPTPEDVKRELLAFAAEQVAAEQHDIAAGIHGRIAEHEERRQQRKNTFIDDGRLLEAWSILNAINARGK